MTLHSDHYLETLLWSHYDRCIVTNPQMTPQWVTYWLSDSHHLVTSIWSPHDNCDEPPGDVIMKSSGDYLATIIWRLQCEVYVAVALRWVTRWRHKEVTWWFQCEDNCLLITQLLIYYTTVGMEWWINFLIWGIHFRLQYKTIDF